MSSVSLAGTCSIQVLRVRVVKKTLDVKSSHAANKDTLRDTFPSGMVSEIFLPMDLDP